MLDLNARDHSTEVDARALGHGYWFHGDGLDGHCCGVIKLDEMGVDELVGSGCDLVYVGADGSDTSPRRLSQSYISSIALRRPT